MAIIPDPDGLTFERWSAQVYDTLPTTVPMPFPEEAWRDWAVVACAGFQVAGFSVPTPEGFETWQDWTREFALAYPNTGL